METFWVDTPLSNSILLAGELTSGRALEVSPLQEHFDTFVINVTSLGVTISFIFTTLDRMIKA